jgi:sulfate/thiosulfate transport system permease protein
MSPARRSRGSRARPLLIAAALIFLALFLVLPLGVVFASAFGKGIGWYLRSIRDPETFHALRLTLAVVAFALPINLAFGVAAAWALARFRFPGRSLILTCLDLPFTVSPVVAGMIFVILCGSNNALGGWFAAHGVKIIFALPGIVLATLFVTSSYVARELIPLLEAQGRDEEEAALSLGASGWQMFRRVALPNMRWGLLYGLVLLNARAMGEFGAVSVVSGHIRGRTNTLPLHVEILYNEYDFAGAFAVASLLALLALATLVAKTVLERISARRGAPVLPIVTKEAASVRMGVGE